MKIMKIKLTYQIRTIALAFILALRHASNDRGLVNMKGLKCPQVSKFVKSNTSEDMDSVTLLPIVKTPFEFYSYIKLNSLSITIYSVGMLVPVSTR